MNSAQSIISPLDIRMKKFSDAVCKMRAAMNNVIIGLETIPFAAHPFQQKNATIMGALLRYKDDCNLSQILADAMLNEYDGTEYQRLLLDKAELIDRYTVRYNDTENNKIISVEYVVPHKNTPEINERWEKFASPHATIESLNDVNIYTNGNNDKIRILDITQIMVKDK